MKYCPVDNCIMVDNEKSNYTYYFCEACKGFWIPGESVQKILKDNEIHKSPILNSSNVRELKCADEHKDLSILKVVNYNDIEIDICESCKGIWLDEGEVEYIKNKIKSNVDINSPSSISNSEFSFLNFIDPFEIIFNIFLD